MFRRVLALAILGGAALVLFGPLALRAQDVGPSVTEPTTQTDTDTIPEMGVVIEPPPADFVPPIAGEQAVELAKSYHTDWPQATRISAVLALYTNEQIQEEVSGARLVVDVPAWVVSIDGVCSTATGGFRPFDEQPVTPDGCVLTDRMVIVDALTGELIEDFGFSR